MIVEEYQPFRIVEAVEFKKFVAMLCSGYTLPSRKTISLSLIPKYYNEVREELQRELQSIKAISLTTDGWTSMNNESFVAVTAHILEKDSKTTHLGCIKTTESHTFENLATC